jgi:putative DNA methylase
MKDAMTVKTRKKLIEVALPLEAINAASAREKSIRHGHPSTLHLWWARRPLAAARAVIFGQMVDDPSSYVDTLLGVPETRRAAERECKKRRELWTRRNRRWRSMSAAQSSSVGSGPGSGTSAFPDSCSALREIWQSWRRTCADNVGHPRAKELFDRNKLPAFHDPFAGGGALPLEARNGSGSKATLRNSIPSLF